MDSEYHRLYGIKRREKAREEGMCTGHPHDPVVPGRKYCQKCLEYKKLKYQQRIKDGICPFHKNVPAVPNKTTCQKCIDRKKLKSLKLIKDGFCPIHSNTPCTPGLIICERCTEQGKDKRKILRKNRLCFVHHDRPAVSKTRCAECLISERIGLLRRNGVPEEELIKAKEAYSNFNGFCQSCGDYFLETQAPHSDHDHATKMFRGIICSGCNTAIGMAKDNPEKLEAMATYLRKNRT